MAKVCIFCGERAGSREHVFPAALGGRRVDKGICCGPHNTGFSPLAACLNEQLRMLNALLAVRPDHKPRAMPLDVPVQSGGQARVFDGEITWLGQVVPDADGTVSLNLVLGGPQGLQAVAYVALTFFAHHFPREARSQGFDAVKAFVLSGDQNEFVWWERDGAPRTSPFEFGHSVVVGTSAASGEACATVSFFETFHFGIRLGVLDAARDRAVTTWIDPLAERPPGDWKIKTADTPFRVVKPEPLTAHLENTIMERVAERQMQIFFNKLQRRSFERAMASPLARLNAVAGRSPDVIAPVVEDVLSHEGTRLRRLLREVFDQFVRANGDDDLGRGIASALRVLMETDPLRPSNLGLSAEVLVSQLGGEIGRELVERLSTGEIGSDVLHHLLESGPAMHRAGEILFRPLRQVLGIVEPSDQ